MGTGAAITFASVYANAGHWLLAIKAAGEVLGQEISLKWAYEPGAYFKILSKNFALPVYRSIPFGGFSPVDIIAGSPPCAGISSANPRSGLDHPMNAHIIRFAEVCCTVNPKIVIMEESANLIKFKEILEQVIRIMQAKYTYVSWAAFDFGDILNIQSRKRCLILATNSDIVAKDIVGPNKLRFSGWREVCADIKTKTLIPYTAKSKIFERIFNSRIAKDRMFTLTGMGTWGCSSIAIREDGKLRPVSVEEMQRIMGFPDNYDFVNTSISWKTGAIARGVPIRETSIILTRAIKEAGL